jgi:hypothetical protein
MPEANSDLLYPDIIMEVNARKITDLNRDVLARFKEGDASDAPTTVAIQGQAVRDPQSNSGLTPSDRSSETSVRDGPGKFYITTYDMARTSRIIPMGPRRPRTAGTSTLPFIDSAFSMFSLAATASIAPMSAAAPSLSPGGSSGRHHARCYFEGYSKGESQGERRERVEQDKGTLTTCVRFPSYYPLLFLFLPLHPCS